MVSWEKKTENDAQMFFLRVQNLRRKIVYIPTDPAFKQPEFICHLEGMIMDYPIQTFIYIGQIAITTGCFFFSRCPASDVSWSINIFNYEYINIYHKANRYWNELWVPSVVCL